MENYIFSIFLQHHNCFAVRWIGQTLQKSDCISKKFEKYQNIKYLPWRIDVSQYFRISCNWAKLSQSRRNIVEASPFLWYFSITIQVPFIQKLYKIYFYLSIYVCLCSTRSNLIPYEWRTIFGRRSYPSLRLLVSPTCLYYTCSINTAGGWSFENV